MRGQAPDSWPLFFLSPKNFEVEADDLVTISELGRGAYGVVEKVRHAQSGTIMAVKVSRAPPGPSPAQPGSSGLRTCGRLPGGGMRLSLWYSLRGALGAPAGDGGGRPLPHGP